MAPEQIRAQTIDGRTDIYALGCVLYEMVTARPPHDAPTVLAMLSKHLIEKPVPPSQRRPELALPAAIDALILGAMAKDPRARPPTMEAFGGQISALVQGLPAAPWRDDTPALDGASSRGLVRVDTAVAFSMLSPRPSPPDTAVRSRTTTHAPGLPDPWPATSPPVMPPPHAPATQRPIGRKAAVIAIAGVIAAAGTAALIIAGQRRSPVPTPPVTARAAAGSEVPPHAAPVERIEPSTDASTAPAPTPATPSWMPTPQPPSPPVRKKVVPPPGPRPRPASRAETPAPAPPPPTPVPAPPPPTPAPASAPVPPVPTPAPASPLPMPGPATFDGQKLALGRGVQLILPPGFTYTVSKDITVINKPGTAVILTVPIPPGNDDPLQLTRVATGNSDMTFVAMSAITVGGVRRPMTTYNAKYNGVTVQIAIVPFIGRRYRLAVIFVVRLALSSDPDILRLRDELYTRRILLP
jgi:serine/threonine-protein kinase